MDLTDNVDNGKTSGGYRDIEKSQIVLNEREHGFWQHAQLLRCRKAEHFADRAESSRRVTGQREAIVSISRGGAAIPTAAATLTPTCVGPSIRDRRREQRLQRRSLRVLSTLGWLLSWNFRMSKTHESRVQTSWGALQVLTRGMFLDK